MNNECDKLFNGDIYFFGAQGTAFGAVRAVRALYPDCHVRGIFVTSHKGNHETIDEFHVKTTEDIVNELGKNGVMNAHIVIAASAFVQQDIEDSLRAYGFVHIDRITPESEADLMRRYYNYLGVFPSLYDIKETTDNKYGKKVSACIFEVHALSDRSVTSRYTAPPFTKKFWAGLTEPDGEGYVIDRSGETIADKNKLYCELTAYYWMWKNVESDRYDYLGISHYRRYLKISENELNICRDQGVDAILPYPMVTLPDIRDHIEKYATYSEWNVVLEAMKELYPDYYRDYERIFSRPYMYNYNMLVMKSELFDDYAEWLFNICFRAEQICENWNINLPGRIMGYFGESLLTWYIVHNEYRLKIRHAARMMRV